MIRAEEILGQIRPPVWRGPTRVHSTAQAEQARAVKASVVTCKAATAIRRAKAAAERPMWIAIGAELRKARKRSEMLRKIVADRLDVAPQSLDDYERGSPALPERCWPAVLELFDIDVAAMVAEWRAAQ